MSTILAALAISSTMACSWDKPGVNPFMGDVVAAVDNYKDIPDATRKELKEKMKNRAYDDIAVIKRDSVSGKGSYSPEITDMHFGNNRMCKTVSRAKWLDDHQERGLVYCSGDTCIIVPTVCRNVSRIKRAAAQKEEELVFDPPGAGAPGVGGAGGGSALVPEIPPLTDLIVPPSGQSLIYPDLPLSRSFGTPLLDTNSFDPRYTFPPMTLPPLPSPPPPALPEPSTYLLFGVGLLSLYLSRKKKNVS
jgi:hypothetical protein